MKVHFTGTGTSQGIPVIGCTCAVCKSADPRDKRLRTAIVMQWEECVLAVDTGPDFRQQMLEGGFDHLDGILMTHEHNDHMAGMDDIRPYYFRRGREFPFYATRHVQDQIRKRFDYFFEEDPYPGVPRVHFQEIEAYRPFWVNGKEILPLHVDHGRLDVMGFKTEDFCYITDAKLIPDETRAHLEGIPVLVLNALRHRPHASHLSLDEAIRIGEELQVGKLYLTHISHELGGYAEVSHNLPGWVNLAYDGLVIDI